MITPRGTVLQMPSGDNPGLLFVAGQQIPFKLANVWQSAVAPSVNQTVEVTLDETGQVTRIIVVDAQTLAKERLGQFADLASDRGQQAAVQGKVMLQHVRGRMGMALMIVCAVLVITWFFVSALDVNIGFGFTKTFSVSDILGIDLNLSDAQSSFGFWSFSGLVAVMLPWVAPWLQARWAPLLNCAPLLLLVVAFAYLRWQMHRLVSQAIEQIGQFGGSQAQTMVSDMINQMSAKLRDATHLDMGFWVVLLLSLYLAGVGITRYMRTPRFSPAA